MTVFPERPMLSAGARSSERPGHMLRRAGCLAGVALIALLVADVVRASDVSPFEPEAIAPTIVPLSQAVTLARVADGGQQIVLLVTGFDAGQVTGIPVTSLGFDAVRDPIDVAGALLGQADLDGMISGTAQVSYPMAQVLSAAGASERNIGIGTNFPEHQAEATMNDVFIFPKFGPPRPPRTSVTVDTTTELLDYEVEICTRFDRTIATPADFDEAVKGFFLCADFTDRANLVRYLDLHNPYSGIGFSDAKSGPEYFPTGPFLVVPRDWKSFVDHERIVTYVDDTQRQDARAGEMILDFRDLTGMALADDGAPTFRMRRKPVTLIDTPAIDKGVNLMSGTAEGVVFRPPLPDEIRQAIAEADALGVDPQDHLARLLVKRDQQERRFLQPGQTVTYKSSHMGDIVIDVLAPGS